MTTLNLKLPVGERVRLVTASGEVIWVAMEYDSSGRKKMLTFHAPPSVRITRDRNLPFAEQFEAPREADHS